MLEVVWQGESAHDVTVGVHHAAWNWPAVRVSRLEGKRLMWVLDLCLDLAKDIGPGCN